MAFPHLGYPRRNAAASSLLAGRTAAVLTASDRCAAGLRQDLSGPLLVRLLREAGMQVVDSIVVPDDQRLLASALREAAQRADLVLTTGGTGLAERDVTPEATLAVCDRLVPGIAEQIRLRGAEQTPFAALGRGVCGISGRALIVNLPGSPAGAENGLRAILPLLPSRARVARRPDRPSKLRRPSRARQSRRHGTVEWVFVKLGPIALLHKFSGMLFAVMKPLGVWGVAASH